MAVNKPLNTSAGTIYLNNLFELHYLHQTRSGNGNSAELEKTVEEQKKRIEALLYDKKKEEAELESYGKQLFQKEQKIKILLDRVNQLENTHSYRKEVELKM